MSERKLIKLDLCLPCLEDWFSVLFPQVKPDMVDHYIAGIVEQRFQIWCMEPHGFLILEFYDEADGNRVLFVHEIRGSRILTKICLAYLEALAISESCHEIACKYVSEPVRRIHLMLGFMEHADNTMRKAVPDGQFQFVG